MSSSAAVPRTCSRRSSFSSSTFRAQERAAGRARRPPGSGASALVASSAAVDEAASSSGHPGTRRTRARSLQLPPPLQLAAPSDQAPSVHAVGSTGSCRRESTPGCSSRGRRPSRAQRRRGTPGPASRSRTAAVRPVSTMSSAWIGPSTRVALPHRPVGVGRDQASPASRRRGENVDDIGQGMSHTRVAAVVAALRPAWSAAVRAARRCPGRAPGRRGAARAA